MTSHDVNDFNTDVLKKSFETPVLVDFWAEWCGPCRILGPVLEGLAAASEGRWVLRKVDTERFPEVSAQYGIRSIPNVKLFSKGNVVNEFVGALPEPAVRQWLEKTLPDPSAETLDHAEALLRSGHLQAAYEAAQRVLSASSHHERARTIAATAVLFSDPANAFDLVKDIDEGSDQWESAGSVQELAHLLMRAAEGNGLEDRPVRTTYLVAVEALKNKDFDRALATFIEVIREDRYYDDDGSRKACIAIFKYLGEDHEITMKHRRDFGSALYV